MQPITIGIVTIKEIVRSILPLVNLWYVNGYCIAMYLNNVTKHIAGKGVDSSNIVIRHIRLWVVVPLLYVCFKYSKKSGHFLSSSLVKIVAYAQLKADNTWAMQSVRKNLFRRVILSSLNAKITHNKNMRKSGSVLKNSVFQTTKIF